MSKALDRLFPFSGRRRKDVLRTGVIWEFSRNLLFEYFTMLHSIRYRGTRSLPTHGPVIFAPNHVSYYDPPLVNAGVPYMVRSMAWDALFRVPGLRALIAAYGAYPVKVKSADKSAVAETLRRLKNGECLVVFPEGNRTEDGRLQPFEHGVARVALQTGSTVVPVTITGAFESWPRTRPIPMPFRPIQVKYHPPIHVEPVTSREELKGAVEDLNARIAKPIARRLRAYERLKKRRATK